MWFDGWSDLLRVALMGAAAYLTLVALLRLLGKRTLAKLNAFDLVVTVALGSTLASALLSADVSWSEGATALAVLGLLQLAVSWTTVRWGYARRAVTARPVLVMRAGVALEGALRRQRLTEGEVRQAVRASGAGGLDEIAAVVLETDGTLSVVTQQQLGDGSALIDVHGWRPAVP